MASGGLVLSATENVALINAGYVRIGTTATADAWRERDNDSSVPPLFQRQSHTAVWTGSEMIVWGGHILSSDDIIEFNDGGRYNPAVNSWTAMSNSGVPVGRHYHTAVWTGNEMIVWGGHKGTRELDDTFSYSLGRVLYLYQRP